MRHLSDVLRHKHEVDAAEAQLSDQKEDVHQPSGRTSVTLQPLDGARANSSHHHSGVIHGGYALRPVTKQLPSALR